MLHPDADLESAFVGLQSGIKSEHDKALEFIENVLKPDVRHLLIPLVDGDIALTEKVELANRILGSRVESKDDALRVLMHTHDPWMKSCAAHLIGILGLKHFIKSSKSGRMTPTTCYETRLSEPSIAWPSFPLRYAKLRFTSCKRPRSIRGRRVADFSILAVTIASFV